MKILSFKHKRKLRPPNVTLTEWAAGGQLILNHVTWDVDLRIDMEATNPQQKYYFYILNIPFYLRLIEGSTYHGPESFPPVAVQELNLSTVALCYISPSEIWVRFINAAGEHYLCFDAEPYVNPLPFNLEAQCLWMTQESRFIALAHAHSKTDSPLHVLSSDIVGMIADSSI